jgi:hypothetical protein
MKPLNLNMDRYTTPTTDAPHELSAAVNLIEKHIPFTQKYDRGYWLKAVSFCNFDHPEEDIRLLLKKMNDTRAWLLTERKEVMNCGGWLTNRLKEQATGPQPRK